MQRLIFVNRYFFPDHSATSQILSDLTFHLAAIGHEVHVITSRQLYDDSRAALPESENINGVQVHRLASTRFGRAALSRRALDYLSFYRSVRRHLHAVAHTGDIVIAKTDPPLLSLMLERTVRDRGMHLVNWLQDIYPETAAILGVPLIRGPVSVLLTALRNRNLRNVDAAVAVGELMAGRILGIGVPAERVHVIANWCDDKTIRPAAGDDNPLRETWHLSGKFVVGYSGNLGRAHDFETVLAAAERLRNELIGDSEGEIGRLIRERRCGTIIRPGDAATLADTLRRWSEQPKSIAEMGARARQMLDARFTRGRAFEQWNRLIRRLASRSQSA
jgi:colanic acid biosynthesis glycosyl transferase WcaI